MVVEKAAAIRTLFILPRNIYTQTQGFSYCLCANIRYGSFASPLRRRAESPRPPEIRKITSTVLVAIWGDDERSQALPERLGCALAVGSVRILACVLPVCRGLSVRYGLGEFLSIARRRHSADVSVVWC